MDAVYATSIGSQKQTIDAVAGDVGAMALAAGLAFPLEQTHCSRMLRGETSRVITDTRAEPAVKDLAATREIGAYRDTGHALRRSGARNTVLREP